MCAIYLVGGSVSGSPQGSRLVDSVGLPVELYPFRALSLSHDSFIRFPKLHLVFGSGSLHLFQSAAGRSLLGQLCWASVYSPNKESLIVSGIGASPWNQFRVRSVIG